jgi:hypothetical protein
MKIMQNQELMNEIGEFVGLQMWNKRDMSKSYEYIGNRDASDELADNYVVSKVIIYQQIPLLVFETKSYFSSQSLYTLNLLTMRPTKNSYYQHKLSKELIDKIKQVSSHA